MIALTSLVPGPERVAVQTRCLASWRAAGLEVRSLNTAAEADELRRQYGVEVIAVEPVDKFTRPYVAINRVVEEVARIAAPTLVINADFELALLPAQLERFAEASADGVAYFLQTNRNPDGSEPVVEWYGLSAFILHPRHVPWFSPSWMCLGKSWWDFWVPWLAVAHGEKLYAFDEPHGYHQRHPAAWDEQDWYVCAAEFARAVGIPIDEEEEFVYSNLSLQVIRAIHEHTVRVPV